MTSNITSIQYIQVSLSTCLPWRIAHARSPQPYLWRAQGELHGEANAKRQALQGAVEHDGLGLFSLWRNVPNMHNICTHMCTYIYTHIYIYIHWRKKKYMDSRSALIHEFGPKRIVLMMRCDVMLCDMNAMCTPNLWQFVCPQSRAILMVKNHGLVLQWRRDAYFEI